MSTVVYILVKLRFPGTCGRKGQIGGPQAANQIPDDASLEDIQYHISVCQKIERGLQDMDDGRDQPRAGRETDVPMDREVKISRHMPQYLRSGPYPTGTPTYTSASRWVFLYTSFATSLDIL